MKYHTKHQMSELSPKCPHESPKCPPNPHETPGHQNTPKVKRGERREQEKAKAHITVQEHTASRQAGRTATADRTDKRFIGSQKPLLRTVLERGD